MDKMWLKLADPMMRGPAVRRWQELSISMGVGQLDADGWFGPHTERITREAQKFLGVTVDGIVGPKTFEAAYERVGWRRRGVVWPS